MTPTPAPRGITATGTDTLANGETRKAGSTWVTPEMAALTGTNNAGPHLNYQTPSGRWVLIQDRYVAGSYRAF